MLLSSKLFVRKARHQNPSTHNLLEPKTSNFLSEREKKFTRNQQKNGILKLAADKSYGARSELSRIYRCAHLGLAIWGLQNTLIDIGKKGLKPLVSIHLEQLKKKLMTHCVSQRTIPDAARGASRLQGTTSLGLPSWAEIEDQTLSSSLLIVTVQL